MRIVLFGGTGQIGRGVLLEALDDPGVTDVLAIGRAKTGESHPRLREVEHRDLFDLAPVAAEMRGADACIFCIGVSAVGMSEADYTRITHDMTLAVANRFLASNPDAAFLFISGQGADTTESGALMWARVKGRTENALLAMPFRAVTIFRPGLVLPERGIQSRTRWYRVFYTVTRPLGGLFVGAGVATTTTLLGLAMLEAVEHPPGERILDNRAINTLGAERLARRGARGRSLKP